METGGKYPEASEAVLLHWHKHDPEQRVGFRGGRFTSPNKLLGFLIACLLTVAFFAALVFISGSWDLAKPYGRIFLE